MGTVTQLSVSAPQATPDEADQAAAFTLAMYRAAVAEGERRVYERLGIPQPAFAPARHLSVLGPVS